MRTAFFTALLLAVVLPAGSARAASHQWRFHEVFTNADGTVQFIEMQECCGFINETELNGKWILAVGAERQYNFRSNLTETTANKHLLLATAAFAALPGAPTPDFIIPAGFLPAGGETLEYWMYPNATWTYGALPTDGVTSMNADGSTGINSPTNFAGQSGSVNAGTPAVPASWGSLKSLWISRGVEGLRAFWW